MKKEGGVKEGSRAGEEKQSAVQQRDSIDFLGITCLVHGHKTQFMATTDLIAESLKEVKLKVMN